MKPPLPLASLDGVERAARALLEAVQIAKGISVVTPGNSNVPTPNAATLVEVCNEFLLAKARSLRADNYLRVPAIQIRTLPSKNACCISAQVFNCVACCLVVGCAFEFSGGIDCNPSAQRPALVGWFIVSVDYSNPRDAHSQAPRAGAAIFAVLPSPAHHVSVSVQMDIAVDLGAV